MTLIKNKLKYVTAFLQWKNVVKILQQSYLAYLKFKANKNLLTSRVGGRTRSAADFDSHTN